MPDAVCVVPVSALRSQSSHKSEMVSQLLFGDVVSVLEEADYWTRIKLQYDGYEGWCAASHLMKTTVVYNDLRPVFSGEWMNTMLLNDVPMYIPFGCDLSLFLDEKNIEKGYQFRYAGRLFEPGQRDSVNDRVTGVSRLFLNTAYIWGGRSVFGIDCSGFSQLVFKVHDIRILRDAWQQAEQGSAISFEDAKQGDLAFFNNEEGRVVHVGILLNENRIIHAAGKVRIDRFNREGIINIDTGLKTHSLCGIRRYF